jgi:hypothetical protein
MYDIDIVINNDLTRRRCTKSVIKACFYITKNKKSYQNHKTAPIEKQTSG